MDLPANLVQEVKRGNAILFLGAGAAMGANSESGEPMLGVTQLINELSVRFLGGDAQKSSLASVAELAISESDLVTVQHFLCELFEVYQPADFHFKIPLFKWKSIYTTNYDLIVERAYSNMKSSPKNLVPIYSSRDRIDSLIKSETDLPYVKLHGCISKTDEMSPPLILTVDQYVTHRKLRETLFERFRNQGSSTTVIFVGHSLEDSDIRQALHEIGQLTNSRPRFYAVMPNFSSMESRLWEGKRVTLLKGNFEKFLSTLEEEITGLERTFVPMERSHEIERRFTSNKYELTKNALSLLQSQLVHIHGAMPIEESKATIFYHGYSKGWGPLQSKFDIHRSTTDDIISQVVLAEEHERSSNTELYLISGSAGAGKSVILKRAAWDSAIDYEKVCLFWNSDERIDIDIIMEIAEKVGERIFIFIDRPAAHIPDLMLMLKKFSTSNLPATVIVAERTNEWNVECGPLHRFLNDDFPVRNLSQKEINELIDKLSEHKCLGVLDGKTRDEQVTAFSQKAGRQLLVSLHEATMAKPFQEIIQDEYRNIVPEKAKLIYRTICVMNRIGVPVRAGIINRIHGVNFETFSDKFFAPLENVVQTITYAATQDYAYEARHPWIAEMVFAHSLIDEHDRFDIYLKLIDSLDIGYSADRTAFRALIKFRSLSELFNNIDNIDKLYDKAHSICGHDDFYYQQRAIFNMRSSKRKFTLAEELLHQAEKYGSHNKSIEHTWAELELARANSSKGLERDRYFNRAEELAIKLTGRNSDSSHGYDTLCKIALLKLTEALEKDDDELITESTKKAESVIRESMQVYPDDEHLHSNEAKLATLLTDNKRAKEALEKAFVINPSNGYLAGSLSKIYLKLGDVPNAKKVLERLIETNPSDKTAYGSFAKILVEHEPNDKLGAEYYWQRSFIDGDTNQLNQLWYARQLYINDKYNEYLKLIEKLKMVRMPPRTRNSIRGLLIDSDRSPIKITGKVVKKEATYALLEANSYSGKHFLHVTNWSEGRWDEIIVGKQITYLLGFTFSGAAAREV